MPPLTSDPYLTNRRQASLGIDAYPSTTADVVRATFEDAWARNPLPSAVRWLGRQWDQQTAGIASTLGIEDQKSPATVNLSPDEANAKYGIAGRLKFDQPVAESVAQDLYQLKRDEIRRQGVLRAAQGGFGEGVAQFGAGLVASALDPLNIAASFIPVVGEARMAGWLARAGESAGARAGLRAGVGAAQGALGAAVVEPIVAGVANSEQADYTMADSLMNVAFGGVLGGGLHAGLGRLGDIIAARRLQEPVLRDAVGSIVEDRPVQVYAPLKAELLRTTSGMRDLSSVFDEVVPPEVRSRVDIGLDAADVQRATLNAVRPDLYANIDAAAEQVRGAQSRLDSLLTKQNAAKEIASGVTEAERTRLTGTIEALKQEHATATAETAPVLDRLARAQSEADRTEARAVVPRNAGVPDARLEEQAAAAAKAVGEHRVSAEKAKARLDELVAQRKQTEEQLARYLASRKNIPAVAELQPQIERAQAALSAAQEAHTNVLRDYNARLQTARAEAVADVQRQVHQYATNELPFADKQAVDAINRILKDIPPAKPGAQSEADAAVLEKDVADFSKQIQQLEASGVVSPEIEHFRAADADLKPLEARAKAAEAAANCQLFRG